jgi:hypothetical protein
MGIIAGAVMIVAVLIDAFEVVILPRRVRHGWRLARFFYWNSWRLGKLAARLFPAGRLRNALLSFFGPWSVFGLVFIWVAGLVTGFGLLHWSLGTVNSKETEGFLTYLYFSATTFFTLGYGDLVPAGATGRALSLVEAGLGYIFLAVIISYLPVLYQSFSRREITISLLDARAGSPPSAGEFLRRLAEGGGSAQPFLVEWERWAAELLETHLSYPMLSYYRSQHDNQSWVGALTTMLDTCALFIAAGDGPDRHQAQLTFAMARHAAVDLSMVFSAEPRPPQTERLSEADCARMWESLRGAGFQLRDGPAVTKALAEVRLLYEPFVNSLAAYFEFTLPRFQPDKPPVDNWQTSAWTPRSPGLGNLPAAGADDHFD